MVVVTGENRPVNGAEEVARVVLGDSGDTDEDDPLDEEFVESIVSDSYSSQSFKQISSRNPATFGSSEEQNVMRTGVKRLGNASDIFLSAFEIRFAGTAFRLPSSCSCFQRSRLQILGGGLCEFRRSFCVPTRKQQHGECTYCLMAGIHFSAMESRDC
tara:strand:- start:197 stop:670 length:474 start_codon:yes stop_codon:yes gene_type:complete